MLEIDVYCWCLTYLKNKENEEVKGKKNIKKISA